MPEPVTRWRVPVAPALLKLAGALLLGAVAALSGADRERLLLAGVAALALGVYGLRDLLAPVRLSAGPDGVTVVSGYARRRRIPWGRIERVGLGEHRSLGRRTELLEIDTGESLHLFGRHDLGVPCAEALAELERVRRSAEDQHPRPEAEEQQRREEREQAPDAAAAEERAGRVDHDGGGGEPQQGAGDDDQ